MKIDLFCQIRNESYILQHFLDHYSSFVDAIYLFDNYSTDDSVQIAKANPKCYIQSEFGSQIGLNDNQLLHFKNNVWKQSTADWVIVCDADELLYHPDIRNTLQNLQDQGITMPHIQGYQMYSLAHPSPHTPLIHTHTMGVPSDEYSKYILFSPKKIKEINYRHGAHTCQPQGKINKQASNLKLLHYKHIGGFDRLIAQYEDRMSFITLENIQNKWGNQYWQPKEKIIQEYTQGLSLSQNII